MTKICNNILCIFQILKSGIGSCTLSFLLSVTKLELHAFQLGGYSAEALEFQAPVLWLAVALGPGSKWRQAGAELGQAQLKLELDFTSTKIWGIALMIANSYQLLHITEQS